MKIFRSTPRLAYLVLVAAVCCQSLVGYSQSSQSSRDKAIEEALALGRARASTEQAKEAWWQKPWRGSFAAYTRRRAELFAQMQKRDARLIARNLEAQLRNRPQDNLLRFSCAYAYRMAYLSARSRGEVGRSSIILIERAKAIMDESRYPWNFEQVRYRFGIESELSPRRTRAEQLGPLTRKLLRYAPKNDESLQNAALQILALSHKPEDVEAYFKLTQQIYKASLKSDPIQAQSIAASGYNMLWLRSEEIGKSQKRVGYAKNAIRHWNRYLQIAPKNDGYRVPTKFMLKGVKAWLAKQES